METKLRESYYLIRQAVKYLIKEYGETETVYVYFRKNSDIILLIEYGKLTYIIKDGITTIYKTTLKNLYLYLLWPLQKGEEGKKKNQNLRICLSVISGCC